MFEAANSKFEIAKIGALVFNKYLSETDAEVIDPTNYSLIQITQAGAAETRTLGNGKEGQFLIMICTAYVADTVVTPAALVGTIITFNADEDVWVGVFLSGEWHTLDMYGSTAVA